MIPSGVVRIIWGLAASDGMRDAMLGDFQEEYDVRERRDGPLAARLWCWRHALRSLLDNLLHSRPSAGAIATSVLPSILWGYVVIALTSAAAVMIVQPLLQLILHSVSRDVTTVGFMAVLSPAAILGGYEAARVGKKAPLWSAMSLGCLLIAYALFLAVLPLWWRILLAATAVPFCLTGAVLQQAQYHRLSAAHQAH